MKLWQIIFICLGFCAGIVADIYLPLTLPSIVWIVFLGFIVMVVWGRNSFAVPAPYIFTCALFIVFVGLGMFRMEVASQSFGHSELAPYVQQDMTLEGVVVREPDIREQSQHLYVQIEDDLVLVTTDRYQSVKYGERISVEGELSIPESFETDLGRTFNYVGYLKAKGVEYIVSFAEVTVVSEGNGNLLVTALLKTKQSLMRGIESVIAEPAAALGEGLLLGVKQGLGDQLETDFRRTGIIHIVVLSGYNVMLVVTFVLFILGFFLPPKARLVFGLLAIVAFALIVGLSATVVRASVMAGLLLLSQSLGRTYEVLRALLFAGFVMLVINPYLLLSDIGFQLSFMATLGLILALPFFESSEQPEVIGFSIKGYVLATVSTQIAVLPLLLYHIGEISLIAVVVNVLVLPMVPLSMLLTFISGSIALVSVTVAMPVAFIAQLTLQYIIMIATWFGGLSFATVSVPAFSASWTLVLYGLIFSIYFFIRSRDKTVHTNETKNWTIEIEE